MVKSEKAATEATKKVSASAAHVEPKKSVPAVAVVEKSKKKETSIGVEEMASMLPNVEVILHVATRPESAFHIDLWLPALRVSGLGYAIVFRTLALYNLYTSLRGPERAVYLKDGANVDAFLALCPNAKVILYPSNTGSAVNFIRFTNLKHVFIGHGDSDKSASCHKFFRVYDEIWTAGQAHIDRFKSSGINFSSLEFRKIGRPGLAGMLRGRGSKGASRSFLYLPTWEGAVAAQEYTSVEFAKEILSIGEEVTDKVAVAKLHPFTGNRRTQLKSVADALGASVESNPRMRLEPLSVLVWDLMPSADFLIADISSVVTDFLAIQKPIFLYIPKGIDIEMSKSAIPFSEYTYIFSNLEELSVLLQEVIVDGVDPLAEGRAKALNYCVDVEQTLSHGFITALYDAVGGQNDAVAGQANSDPSLARERGTTVSSITRRKGAI